MANYIPKSITYIHHMNWNNHVFPVETGKNLDTAYKWADRNYPKSIQQPKTEIKDNEPFTNVKIVSYTHRKDNTVYNVSVDGMIVDMREDVIHECLMNTSIVKGVLEGEFVWAKYGGHMKLVRVGSDIHKKFL